MFRMGMLELKDCLQKLNLQRRVLCSRLLRCRCGGELDGFRAVRRGRFSTAPVWSLLSERKTSKASHTAWQAAWLMVPNREADAVALCGLRTRAQCACRRKRWGRRSKGELGVWLWLPVHGNGGLWLPIEIRMKPKARCDDRFPGVCCWMNSQQH